MSDVYSIKEIRKILIEELKDYDGARILLPYENEILKRIFFDKGNREYVLTPDLIDIFPKIDFRNISFEGVNVSSSDFSNLRGVFIDPKNRDMSNSNFNGVEFTNDIGNCDITGASFKGSKNARINPETITKKRDLESDTILHDLTNVDFANVEFLSKLRYCSIKGSSFKGSKGAVISPKLMHYDFSRVNFENVKFTGSLYNNYIVGSSFKGSKGAVIDSTSIRPTMEKEPSFYDLTNVNFADVEFNVVIDNKYKIDGTSFKGSKGAIIDFDNMPVGDYETCDFTDVQFNGNIDAIDDPKIKNVISSNISISSKEFSEEFRQKIKSLKK